MLSPGAVPPCGGEPRRHLPRDCEPATEHSDHARLRAGELRQARRQQREELQVAHQGVSTASFQVQ